MPKTQAKYQAKPVFWNSQSRTVMKPSEITIYRVNKKLKLPSWIWRFDSQHEFKVYLELVRMYGTEHIKRQYVVELIPSDEYLCCPRGKNWKVDFAIMATFDSSLPVVLVEAKGAMLPEFVTTLQFLEIHNAPAFEDLTIVFSDRIPMQNKTINNLCATDYESNLLTLSQLKNRTSL